MSKKMDDIMEKSKLALREHLANMTPEEEEELKESLRDKNPKGWNSIEDCLPAMLAMDIMKGYTEIKVKDKDGIESISHVSDHNVWYHIVKEAGITHWWND